MKKQSYKEFVENNKWFRERPHDRKNFQTKISRVANSIQCDVVQGPAFDLLNSDEQNLIREASKVLKELKEKIQHANKHVAWLEESSKYRVVTVHREKYRQLISEQLLIDEETYDGLLKATVLILHLNSFDSTDSVKYVMLLEARMRPGKYNRSPEELANYIHDRYIYEIDQFAYKAYDKELDELDYELLHKRLVISDITKTDVLKLYESFFTKISRYINSG
ncbi:hypothetical protein LCGC14_0522120 [marine sediment metagenome]|uniref:Uncharacterized protein n=1 Tax=marine sediment metagenome TaxID=412755 RepID=A0A0F9RY67_9ZZZZ